MPDDRLTQVKWISRVLGVAVPLGEVSEPNFDFTTELHDRLAEVLGMVRTLADRDTAGRIVALGQQAKAAIDANQLADASMTLDVMEAALTEARRAAFMATVAKEAGHRVEYGKLLLTWRTAQEAARQRLQALGAAILTDQEVKNDPRYKEVQEAARDLTDVLPDFGPDLADALDALDKARDEKKERAALIERAQDLIDDYVALLDGAEELAELTSFAGDEDYEQGDLGGDLREALGALALTLEAAS
ncbi:MAG TPA: hypothetical protein VFE41_05580 [Acetobacteraceae bacterium]|jgi:hypothetical protein|nr:hypothetical protein [Acetobacteraceae bacterium]